MSILWAFLVLLIVSLLHLVHCQTLPSTFVTGPWQLQPLLAFPAQLQRCVHAACGGKLLSI